MAKELTEEQKKLIEDKKNQVAELKKAYEADKNSVPAKLDYIIGLLELKRLEDEPPDDPPPG